MNDTLDKVAVITGAGSGLGAATARRFHREGWRLVLGDLRPEGVQALAQELGATALACDVADERQVEALVQAALDRHGRLDCMINNAGILGAIGPIGTTAARDFNRVLEVMVSGVFHGTKHAANAMGDQGGVILNTASLAGVGAWANHSYTAAKHAVVGLTLDELLGAYRTGEAQRVEFQAFFNEGSTEERIARNGDGTLLKDKRGNLTKLNYDNQ